MLLNAMPRYRGVVHLHDGGIWQSPCAHCTKKTDCYLPKEIKERLLTKGNKKEIALTKGNKANITYQRKYYLPRHLGGEEMQIELGWWW